MKLRWVRLKLKVILEQITLTKYAEDGKTILKGAEFKLYKATKDKVKEENSGVSALRFIKLGDGIYKLALADNEATSTDTLVAVNGTLTVKGLDEGTEKLAE